jgi:hypothetical protein
MVKLHIHHQLSNFISKSLLYFKMFFKIVLKMFLSMYVKFWQMEFMPRHRLHITKMTLVSWNPFTTLAFSIH